MNTSIDFMEYLLITDKIKLYLTKQETNYKTCAYTVQVRENHNHNYKAKNTNLHVYSLCLTGVYIFGKDMHEEQEPCVEV